MYKMKTWQNEVTGYCGNTVLFGRNIFAYDRKETCKCAVVKDGGTYRLTIYMVNIDGEFHRFDWRMIICKVICRQER